MYRKTSKQCQLSHNIDSENDNNKSRRSSLQVNLSYTFDLSDSINTDNSQTQNTVNKKHDDKNTNKITINNDINCVLASINDKNEVLSKNCSRLRDAILNKTKELFDENNDVCKMTTKILDNQSNLTDKHCKLNQCSPILRGSRNYNEIKFSPRKTRASTMREHLKSFIELNSQTIINDNVNEITTIGSPIISSTFNDNHCNIHESCNIKKKIYNPIKSVNITQQSVCKLNMNVDQEIISTVSKKGKPSIRNIQTCNVELDKIDGYQFFQQVDKSKVLDEIPMELTNVQRNCILNEPSLLKKIANTFENTKINSISNSIIKSKVSSSRDNLSNVIDEMSSDCPKTNYSMHVNTSLDKLSNFYHKLKNENSKKSQNGKIELKNYTNINVDDDCDETKTKVDLSTNCEDLNDDLSLMQRLRNISQYNNQEKSVKIIQRQYDKSPGIVECTPLPITRSMLLKTQSKLNSQREKSKSQNKTVNKSKNHRDQNSETKTVELEKTVILDSTPFRIKNYNNGGPVIIQETSDDESSDEINVPINNVKTVSSGKPLVSKRKLFTQHDSSELASFSPLSNNGCSPHVSKLKRLKRRQIRRNVAGRIINPQVIIGKSQRQPLTQIIVTSSSTSSQDSEKNRDLGKIQKKKRQIKSKKIIMKKQPRVHLLNVINKIRDNSFDGDPETSRNSNVFMTKKQIPIKRKYGNQKIFIVSTGLCNGDKDVVKSAVKKLGGATIEASVTRKTTHVITTGVRTINLLRGIIRGCWLVKFDWIKQSIEAEKWLPAVKYEIDHFSKAVQENRRDKEIFGHLYVPDLFATCGLIHVQNNTTPPKEILKELIKTAGGLIIEEPKKSKIIIGQQGIKENWVLDSITTGELQSIESYKRS